MDDDNLVEFVEDEGDRLRKPSTRFQIVTYKPRPDMSVEQMDFMVNGRLYQLGPGFRTGVKVTDMLELCAQAEGMFPGSQVLIYSDSPKEGRQ